MVIGGFQPFSMLDYPGKSCSIVFTQGCPFRCAYCHNPDLISTRPTTTVSEESIFVHLIKHRNMLDGVCITGGEPTIQPDLRAFIEKIKALGLLVKLDTNGIHPHAVRALIAAGLVDYIAMDVKHRWERYADVTRIAGERSVRNCRDTFAIIQESGVDHEFRTTLLPGTHAEEDLLAMAGYLKDGESYYIQDFRSGKTLEQNIPNDTGFNTADTVLKLRNAFPHLTIQLR